MLKRFIVVSQSLPTTLMPQKVCLRVSRVIISKTAHAASIAESERILVRVYLKNIDEDDLVGCRQVHLMARCDEGRDFLDHIISLEGVVCSYSRANGVLQYCYIVCTNNKVMLRAFLFSYRVSF